MSRPPTPPCTTCGKPTEKECSHIDCPNRHLVTAQPKGNPYNFPACGMKVPTVDYGDR